MSLSSVRRSRRLSLFPSQDFVFAVAAIAFFCLKLLRHTVETHPEVLELARRKKFCWGKNIAVIVAMAALV